MATVSGAYPATDGMEDEQMRENHERQKTEMLKSMMSSSFHGKKHLLQRSKSTKGTYRTDGIPNYMKPTASTASCRNDMRERQELQLSRGAKSTSNLGARTRQTGDSPSSGATPRYLMQTQASATRRTRKNPPKQEVAGVDLEQMAGRFGRRSSAMELQARNIIITVQPSDLQSMHAALIETQNKLHKEQTKNLLKGRLGRRLDKKALEDRNILRLTEEEIAERDAWVALATEKRNKEIEDSNLPRYMLHTASNVSRLEAQEKDYQQAKQRKEFSEGDGNLRYFGDVTGRKKVLAMQLEGAIARRPSRDELAQRNILPISHIKGW